MAIAAEICVYTNTKIVDREPRKRVRRMARPAYEFAPCRPPICRWLRRWLACRMCAEWWGEPESEIGYMRDIDRRAATRHARYIFAVDGRPFGYCQCWLVGHHQTAPGQRTILARRAARARRGSRPVRSAEPDKLIAGHRLQRLCARSSSAWLGEGTPRVIIDPDPRNSARACGPIEKAGFPRHEPRGRYRRGRTHC